MTGSERKERKHEARMAAPSFSDLPDIRDDEQVRLDEGTMERTFYHRLPWLRYECYDANELRGARKAQRRRTKHGNRSGTRKGRA